MYIVTQVFENAIEIWDQTTKDEEAKPAGQMTIFMDPNEFRVGDIVQLTVRKQEDVIVLDAIIYPSEPVGRSGVRSYGTFREVKERE